MIVVPDQEPPASENISKPTETRLRRPRPSYVAKSLIISGAGRPVKKSVTPGSSVEVAKSLIIPGPGRPVK